MSMLFVVTDAKCCNSKYSGILDKYTCAKQGFPAVLHVKAATVMANLALVAPARNCDVGTAEEQGNRFNHFCASNYSACDVDMECCRCPLVKSRVPCEFAWAHRPIEENNEGATDGE